MSVYTYVPGKAELIDLMLDTVMGKAPGPDETGGGWRKELELVARRNWELYHRIHGCCRLRRRAVLRWAPTP